ncbi:MAG: hypothetical protein WC107_04675 [Patescibacteria group bacterium]
MQIKPPERFELTDAEKHSVLWQRLKEFLKRENDRDRLKNDCINLSDEETRNLRAMIAARKSLLNLDQ